MPTIGPAFEPLPERPRANGPRCCSCASELQDQLDRGATHAFSPSFGLARPARPARPDPDRPRAEGRPVSVRERGARCWSSARSSPRWSWSAPTSPPAAPPTRRRRPRTPASTRPWRNPEGLEQIAEQFSLSALDGAACQLGVSRETLARALATPEARERFTERYGIADAELARAIRAGLLRAVDDAEEAGALSPLLAGPLRATLAADPARPGDRTDPERPLPARQRRRASSAPPRASRTVAVAR